MRIMTFEINVNEWMKRHYNLTETEMNEWFHDMNNFRCTYILSGNGNLPDHYELLDENGNYLNINDCNGFQKGVVLNDCFNYFVCCQKDIEANPPCGVLKIYNTDVVDDRAAKKMAQRAS